MTVSKPVDRRKQHKPKPGHPWTGGSFEKMAARKAAIAAAKARRAGQ